MTKEKEEIYYSTKNHVCPICNENINNEDWNVYYGACEKCVNKSGRLG